MPWENVYRTDEVYGGFGHLEIKKDSSLFRKFENGGT